jgi:hypothetical protein
MVAVPEALLLRDLECDFERDDVFVISTVWVRVGMLRDSVTAFVSVTTIVSVTVVEGWPGDIDNVLVTERSAVGVVEFPMLAVRLFDVVRSAVTDFVGVGGGVMVGVRVGGSENVSDQDIDLVGVGGGVMVGVFVSAGLSESVTDLERRSALSEDDVVLVMVCSLEKVPAVGDGVGDAEGVPDIPVGDPSLDALMLCERVCVGRGDWVTEAPSFDAVLVKLHANDTDGVIEYDLDRDGAGDADLEGDGLCRVLERDIVRDGEPEGVGVGGGVIVEVRDGVTDGVVLNDFNDTVGSSVAVCESNVTTRDAVSVFSFEASSVGEAAVFEGDLVEVPSTLRDADAESVSNNAMVRDDEPSGEADAALGLRVEDKRRERVRSADDVGESDFRVLEGVSEFVWLVVAFTELVALGVDDPSDLLLDELSSGLRVAPLRDTVSVDEGPGVTLWVTLPFEAVMLLDDEVVNVLDCSLEGDFPVFVIDAC